jgi:hypothetical protein
VNWVVRDHLSNVIAKGQYSPSGTLVIVSFTLPSTVEVPLDGSKYSITATDGTSSAVDYFYVVAPEELSNNHGVEIAYLQGKNFVDSIVLPSIPEFLEATVILVDGTVVDGPTPIDTSSPTRMGQSYVFRYAYGGPIDTRTETTMGVGTVMWDYTLTGQLDSQQEIHPFYTITPYSSDYLNAIKKIVDKTRIGDTNYYLKITMTDLAHALVRGADYVMQSDPLMTGFPLDLMPRMLRDYIIKAAAIDLLRAQYLAEGMSVFDMQGLGVQLNVDRTQYIDALVNQLTTDMQTLTAAKNKWLQQGAPLGAAIPVFKRPIGVLGLTTGTYTNWPMVPQPFRMLSSSLYSWSRYGPLN